MAYYHLTAMPTEAVSYLNCNPGKIIVDATLGGAGHSKRICPQLLPNGLLIGIDQDQDAIINAQTILRDYASNILLVHENFTRLPEILANQRIRGVDGILLDLGLSLHHIKTSGRGFSFSQNEPLDMRMDIRQPFTAQIAVNTMTQKQLTTVFRELGEERYGATIARKIVSVRKHRLITSSRQLADIVCQAIPVKAQTRQNIHPATRVFMALRILVNNELENLQTFLSQSLDLLLPDGRLCVLTFHSLEDRIVKHQFRRFAQSCICPKDLPQCVCQHEPLGRIVTPKPLTPSNEELAQNPMARSAKLRVIEKI